MDLSIDVVIPVLNECNLTDALLSDISKNTVHPQKVILIDNASTDDTPGLPAKYGTDLDILYIRNDENIGVNASWNLGIKTATSDLVSVLNNDLVLNSQFFEGVLKCFSLNTKVGMVCPRTVQGDPSQIEIVRSSCLREGNLVTHVPWRWGWAFTLRRSLALQVLVPDMMFNYCGDDYQYFMVKKLGYDILCADDNLVYHYGAITGRNSNLDQKMYADTHIWNILKEKLESANGNCQSVSKEFFRSVV